MVCIPSLLHPTQALDIHLNYPCIEILLSKIPTVLSHGKMFLAWHFTLNEKFYFDRSDGKPFVLCFNILTLKTGLGYMKGIFIVK